MDSESSEDADAAGESGALKHGGAVSLLDGAPSTVVEVEGRGSAVPLMNGDAAGADESGASKDGSVASLIPVVAPLMAPLMDVEVEDGRTVPHVESWMAASISLSVKWWATAAPLISKTGSVASSVELPGRLSSKMHA